jgi:hypothetical protein
MLKHALAPRFLLDDSYFKRFSPMVEEIRTEHNRPFKCAALSEHLDRIIAVIEADPRPEDA